MKRFLFVIIASAMLMSGCNNPELDSRPGSVPSSSENETQTNGQSSTEITISEPVSESSTVSQHTSTNEPIISDYTSSYTSSTSVQNSSTVISSSSENTVSNSESDPTSTVSTTSTVSSSSTTKLPELSGSDSNNSQSPINREENTLSITITANGRKYSATLYDSETARAFIARLPLSLDMSELNGNEKYYYLPDSLPTNSSRPSRINTGDIMLYGNSCLVIFYESFSTSYSYTPIGKIDDPDGLAAALGSGSVQVAFN